MATTIDGRNLHLTVKKGATFTLNFTYNNMGTNTDPNNIDPALVTPVTMDGWRAKMEIRYRPLGPVVWQGTTENGGILITPETGQVEVTIDGRLTQEFPFNTDLEYDILLIRPDEFTYRPLQGKVFIDQNVTVRE